MPDSGPQDARLQELAFLAQLERDASVRVEAKRLHEEPAYKSLILHLLVEGCINGLECDHASSGYSVTPQASAGGRPNLQSQHETRLWRDIAIVLGHQEIFARISHKGRLRRSELEQALRTGRDRESFGILWAERHREQAVTMAVLSAQPTSPVSVAYLDMNGLKSINDTHDHHAGDVAIRTYLQTVAMLMGERAEGFRGGSSDEVVVVMRGASLEDARTTMRAVLRQLGKEKVSVDGKVVVPRLTAACGVAATVEPTADPQELVRRADREQKRAKDASRQGTDPASPRPSYLAADGVELEKVE